MLGLQKVMAFVATADSARATVFYRDVLGLSLVADEQWAVVFDANGTLLRIQKVPELTPAPYTALGWDVPDIRRTMAALGDRGVTFERYPLLPQDELGIWTTPDGTQIAWFKDPDGNVLSLTQF
jgi:catechol 2,3-dioxygenase-like lactoylglutathione lyase family enzyme